MQSSWNRNETWFRSNLLYRIMKETLIDWWTSSFHFLWNITSYLWWLKRHYFKIHFFHTLSFLCSTKFRLLWEGPPSIDPRKPYLTFCDQVAARVRANPMAADGSAMVELRRFCAGCDCEVTVVSWRMLAKMFRHVVKNMLQDWILKTCLVQLSLSWPFTSRVHNTLPVVVGHRSHWTKDGGPQILPLNFKWSDSFHDSINY